MMVKSLEISVITLFPRMFAMLQQCSIYKRGIENRVFNLNMFNLRDFSEDVHRTVDDRPYGGGPGMVMKPEPLSKAIDVVRQEYGGPVIYLSPQGQTLSQSKAKQLSTLESMVLVCGRYEGIDQRVIDSRVDYEISLGDYIISGGELAAMVLIESVIRLLPGVLGNELSAQQDSFSKNLLDWPHYTRPECFEDNSVPKVLLNGNHEEIARWRLEKSLEKTSAVRPDLFAKAKHE